MSYSQAHCCAAFAHSVPAYITYCYGIALNKQILYFSRTVAVKPTGIVDLITMIASGLYSITSLITASTAEVSKKFFLLS